MKVELLVILLSLDIWICSCETKQNDENGQELVWKEMRSSLQNIQPSDRPTFLIMCGGSHNCTQTILTNIKWMADIGEPAKNRFWKTYECFKTKDIKKCPVDGHWGTWSPWSKCTARCGEEGNSTSTRLCNNPHQVHGGLTCSGFNARSRICRGKCELRRKQTRALVESENFLSKIHQAYPQLRPLCLVDHCLYEQADSVLQTGEAEKYWSSLQCVKYKRACPVDGSWTSWTHWTSCQPNCGSGVRWRSKKCASPPPANNGLTCRGAFYQEEPCVGRKCTKKDFVLGIYVSHWTVFGPCSVSCGQFGVREKRRVCLSPGKCGDLLQKNGNEIVIQKPCFRGPCPVDGKWSDWSPYTNCSAVCGKGRKIRIRTCDAVSSDGAVCTGQSVNVTSCENQCEKDTTLVDGTGDVTAMPFVPVNKVPPKVGKPDPKNPYMYELEPELLDHFTPWSAWSQCSKSCETGQKSRSRNCTVPGPCFGEVRQVLFCNTDKCSVYGGWSEWLAWSHCSVTCGPGKQKRYRKCDRPLPQFGGTCRGSSEEVRKCNLGACKGIQLDFAHWEAWSPCSKQCGGGARIRSRNCKLRRRGLLIFKYLPVLPKRMLLCISFRARKMLGSCGQMPCQVKGDWAHWGSWSACSHSCGGGFHFRDRTCTDPSPLYGGDHCRGHGSEVTPCFHGPCPDREDTGVRMNGSSGLLYSPFHKPQSYLSIHLLLYPLRPHGTIMYRWRECKLEKCRHDVNVSLVDSKPEVVVVDRGAKIIIKSNTSLQMQDWNTVYVYLSQHHGFMRVNNGAHLRAKYHRKPTGQVNYDSQMTLGSNTEDSRTGFVGVIAEARVNFQVLSLRRITGWSGFGMPEDEWLTRSVHVDPVTKYPKFKSDTFIKLPTNNRKTLNIQMSVWPQQLEGLVLFNEGRVPGSFVYLIIYKGVFRFCFNCGQLSVCENVQDVEAKRWYHVSIVVSGITSNIRINFGKAVQLTSPGVPYHAGLNVFLGGGESHDWVIFTAITGTAQGFSGTFHEVSVNGQPYMLRTQPLVDSRGFLNTEGVSSTEKMMDVFEQTNSKVILKCDYSRFAHSGGDVYVEWFHVDTKIKSSPDRKITPRLPGDSYLGALTLSAKHHGSGLYVCLVRHNGRLTNHITFVLIRDDTSLVYGMANMEMTAVQDFIIIMALCFLFVLVFSTFKMFQLAREDGIRPMLEKLKLLKARVSNRDKEETEFPQPPGKDDLYKAELITEEPNVDSNGDIRDSQDSDSEISEASDNCEDNDIEGQPITQSLQNMQNHPSMHTTSEGILHTTRSISHAARKSSISLYGTQSARDDINDTEIPKRSSVKLRGTYSARDDINDTEMPRRSSVKFRETQSARDGINDTEIHRRSSVKLRGTQSTRDDIDDEILSSEIVTIDDSQYDPPDQIHETSQWSPYSVPSGVAKDMSSLINSQGDVSRGVSSHRASRIDDTRGVSSQMLPNLRPSYSSRGRIDSSHQVQITENSDVNPTEPQISWTHRSTQKIATEAVRSRTSQSPCRPQSSILENQLSCSLPPAGSPSPPKTPLVRTSPTHQQPDFATAIPSNRSLRGTTDSQFLLQNLPSTQSLPPPPNQNIKDGEGVLTSSNEDTSSDKSSSSSDQSSELDTGGSDSEASLPFPPLPRPPSPTP